MRNTKKAFTLVELIVVITILAILGTIAFISFGGQTAGARNTKVTSDTRNISSAIEVATSWSNPTTLIDIVTSTWILNITNDTNLTIWSGSTLDHDPTSNVYYLVGNVNYNRIGQNGEDFKDPNAGSPDVDYIFWVVNTPDFKAYQIAGQIIDNDMKKARISGTFFRDERANAEWILTAARWTAINTILINGATNIGIGENNNLY